MIWKWDDMIVKSELNEISVSLTSMIGGFKMSRNKYNINGFLNGCSSVVYYIFNTIRPLML